MSQHTHHFVPRTVGRIRVAGGGTEPQQELRCNCGATPPTTTTTKDPS